MFMDNKAVGDQDHQCGKDQICTPLHTSNLTKSGKMECDPDNIPEAFHNDPG